MPAQSSVFGNRYMIATGQYLASQVGLRILEAGGNAVDAGVGAGIALGVVHSDQVQFSGVAPIMIYLAERQEAITISGLGWWPKALPPDLFVREHGGKIPAGLLRTVVPGAPDAWLLALERYGTMSFADVAADAIRFAREGFAVHSVMAQFLRDHESEYKRWPSNEAIYMREGRALREGERIVQVDLARSLQFMADEERAAAAKGGRKAGLAAARDAFYRGDIAHAIARFHRENGGLLTMEDLGSYRSEIEAPLRLEYRGIEVLTCGPWCQGPVLLQILSLLDGYDLAGLGHNSPDYIHVVVEAMNLCFADRERFYGDPRFVDVPIRRLLSPEYAAERRKLIDPKRAFGEMPPHGDAGGATAAAPPPATTSEEPGLPGDTSYVCVVDEKGNAFSATPSDVSWDSPVIPGLGFCPSARGSQSWGDPRHTSCAAPGKRPRLTPNPSLALRRGEWVMPFGAPGGDMQPQGMVQVFLNHIVFGMELQKAIEAPRFVTRNFPDTFEPHSYYPGRVDLEAPIGKATGEALAARGHDINWIPELSLKTAGVCAISADHRRGVLQGGADPRRTGRAMGW